jgi:hypothetical protein
MVERMRGSEARMIIGDIRKLAAAYKLANGTCTGMTTADVNIGTAQDQIPSSCRASHWFFYYIEVPGWGGGNLVYVTGSRCGPGGGGRSPEWPVWGNNIQLIVNVAAGTDTWLYGIY